MDRHGKFWQAVETVSRPIRLIASTDCSSWRFPLTSARKSHDSVAKINQLTKQIKAVPPLRTVWVGDRVAADAKGPFHVFIGGSPQRKGISCRASELIDIVRMSLRLTSLAKIPAKPTVVWRWLIGLCIKIIRSRRESSRTGFGIITLVRVSSARQAISVSWVVDHRTRSLLDWLAAKLVGDQVATQAAA